MDRSLYVIPFAICIGGLIVAGAVYFALHKPEASTASGGGNPALVRPVAPTDHILGDPSAPVVVVEYADLDCSYCAQFDQTMQEIMDNYGANGQVAWVFRNFPLTQLHPNALTAAEAAECVASTAGNDAYWKFIDSMFANQPVAPSQYGAYATKAGADPDKVATCETATSTIDAHIDADSGNATAIGALGTPYSLILVKGAAPIVVNGAFPYDAMKQEIEKALQEAQ